MFRNLGFFVCLSLLGTACFNLTPPVAELHTQAAKDFECPPKQGLIDTRTEARPVNLGSTQRMTIQGCGHKAIYHYDSANSVWVREPDATTTTTAAAPAK
jgi:hypothetical protein